MKAQTTVDAEEIARFTAMADEWWDTRGKFAPLHRMNPLRIRYIQDAIAQHFSPTTRHPSPLTLLDIGCGGGLIAEPMAQAGMQVTGIDAGEKNIAVAKLHAEKSGLDIDYRCTTAEALLEGGVSCHPERAEGSRPFDYAQGDNITASPPLFDIVLALEIIEHVADVEAFVEASCALLKPGGLMVYSTLNRTAKSYALAIIGAEYIMRWLPIGTHDWKKFLKPHELVNPLRNNGVSVKEMTGMVYNPLTQKWRLDAKDMDVNYLVVGEKKNHPQG